MQNRIKEIQEMIKNDPKDPFLLYALALEFMKIQDEKKAIKAFNTLLSSFPEYLPTYYQAAHFFYQHKNLLKARETFDKGIQLAEKLKDLKTLKELNAAYEQFLFETDNDY